MFSTLHTAFFYRGDIISCSVETEISNGIGIHVVGVQDSQVKESLLRVITALEASGFRIPGKKIVIDIAPHGGNYVWAGSYRPSKCAQAFDLAIALGILIASEQISGLMDVDNVLFFSMLNLDGKLAAPYTGIQPESAASVLSWQLRRNWKSIIGYPVDNKEERMNTFIGKESLKDVISLIEEGRL